MVAPGFEFAALACGADGIPRAPEENCCLGDVERSRAVLEHLWNTNVVHRWGWLVKGALGRCRVA
jgi:hypothetical protein